MLNFFVVNTPTKDTQDQLNQESEEPPPEVNEGFCQIFLRRVANCLIGNSRSNICHSKKCLFGSLLHHPTNRPIDTHSS